MKINNIKLKPFTYKRVCISWIDSTMRKQVWWNYKDLDDDINGSENEDIFYSVGYLFKETKLHYYLANSIHSENKSIVSFGSIFSIPRGCVLKVDKL